MLLYGLTTLNKSKSQLMESSQFFFNAAVSTSVESKTNTKKFYFCGETINERLCKYNVTKYVTFITETPILLLCTFSEK